MSTKTQVVAAVTALQAKLTKGGGVAPRPSQSRPDASASAQPWQDEVEADVAALKTLAAALDSLL